MRKLYGRIIGGSILVLLLGMAHSMAVHAQDLEYVSSTLFGGEYPTHMEIDGYLLTGWWPGTFQVFSIDDSLSPQQIGGNTFISNAVGMARSGDYVYFSTYDFFGFKLEILDISDISRATLTAELDFEHTLTRLDVSGDYIYVCGSLFGERIYIFDVSDAYDPFLAGQYELPGVPLDIVIVDTLAYLIGVTPGMTILDISDSLDPQQVGVYGGGVGNGPSLFLRGYYAVVISDMLLLVIDASDPTDPVLAGQCNLPLDFTIECCVSGDYAYATSVDGFSEEAGVAIVDISNPSDPAVVGFIDCIDENHYGCIGVAATGSYVYVGVGSPELVIETWDVSDPTNPTPVGGYEGRVSVDGVFATGEYAYAYCWPQSMSIVDISNPEFPMIMSDRHTPWFPVDCFVSGDYAYVPEGTYGLEIVDVSDPANPFQAGFYAGEVPATVFLVDNLAYIGGDGLLEIVDIANPSDPVLLGETEIFGYPYDVCVRGNYAFMAAYYGLRIVDVSNPANPVLVRSYDTPGDAVKIAVSGDFAYVADSQPGVQIFDISDPTAPVLAGSFDPRPSYIDVVDDIEIFDNYLAVAVETAGVYIADMADPINPIVVASFDTPGKAQDLSVSGDYITVADSSSLMLLRFTRTGVEEDGNVLPNEIALLQNYPNPFNAATVFNFSLPETGHIVFSVYSILGQKAATLFDGEKAAGNHTVSWDASDFPSGVYFARLEAGERSETIKMVLLK